jgi:hypothetical protein
MLSAALVLLGILAAVALAMSNLPPVAALPSGLLAAAYGVWLARREWRRPRLEFAWRDLCEPRVVFRGALVSLTAMDRDGTRLRLNWWPDTLSDEARRRLRLAAQRTRSA